MLEELNGVDDCKTKKLPQLRKIELLGDQADLVRDPEVVFEFINQRYLILTSMFELNQVFLAKFGWRPEIQMLLDRGQLTRIFARSLDPSQVAELQTSTANSNLRLLSVRNDVVGNLRRRIPLETFAYSVECEPLGETMPNLRVLHLSRVYNSELALDCFPLLESLKLHYTLAAKISLPTSIKNIELESLRGPATSAVSDAIHQIFEENPARNLNLLQFSSCCAPWRVIKTMLSRIEGRIQNLCISNFFLPDSEIEGATDSAASSSPSDSESSENESNVSAELIREAKAELIISLIGIEAMHLSADADLPRFRLQGPTIALKSLTCSLSHLVEDLAASWPPVSPLKTFHVSSRRFSDQELGANAARTILAKSKLISSLSLPPMLSWTSPGSFFPSASLFIRVLQLSGPQITDRVLSETLGLLPCLLELSLGTCRSVSSLSWLSHDTLAVGRFRSLEGAEIDCANINSSLLPQLRELDIAFKSARKVSIKSMPQLSRLGLRGAVSRSISISDCSNLAHLTVFASSTTRICLDVPAVSSLSLKMPLKANGGSVRVKSKCERISSISIEVSSPRETKSLRLIEALTAPTPRSPSLLQSISLTPSLDDNTDSEEDEADDYQNTREEWKSWCALALAAIAHRQPTIWDNLPNLRRVETPLKTHRRPTVTRGE